VVVTGVGIEKWSRDTAFTTDGVHTMLKDATPLVGQRAHAKPARTDRRRRCSPSAGPSPDAETMCSKLATLPHEVAAAYLIPFGIYRCLVASSVF